MVFSVSGNYEWCSYSPESLTGYGIIQDNTRYKIQGILFI